MFGQKNIFEEALALYAGPHVVERVRKHKREALRRFSEDVQLTLLVQDIKPFTTFNEKLSAKMVGEILNEYLDRMSACVEEHGGVIDHFRGDSIIAYWEPVEGDRVVASVKCAKEIGKELTQKWRDVLPGEIVPLHGVDCGVVARGNFGASNRMSYAIMGDVLNFTMRLCSGNDSFQTQSLFSSRVRSLVSNQAELKFRESIVVKGRAKKEDLFTLEDLGSEKP